jgi:hypothetical protein
MAQRKRSSFAISDLSDLQVKPGHYRLDNRSYPTPKLDCGSRSRFFIERQDPTCRMIRGETSIITEVLASALRRTIQPRALAAVRTCKARSETMTGPNSPKSLSRTKKKTVYLRILTRGSHAFEELKVRHCPILRREFRAIAGRLHPRTV